MKYSLEPNFERVEKPWGYEIILTPSHLNITGKVLHVFAGKKLSLQYHEKKEEVLTLYQGKALIWLENDLGEMQKIPMEIKKGYLVVPGQKHRIEAMEDSDIFEVSTPELGTTVRVDDDYQRPDETESLRQEKNRGWIN